MTRLGAVLYRDTANSLCILPPGSVHVFFTRTHLLIAPKEIQLLLLISWMELMWHMRNSLRLVATRFLSGFLRSYGCFGGLKSRFRCTELAAHSKPCVTTDKMDLKHWSGCKKKRVEAFGRKNSVLAAVKRLPCSRASLHRVVLGNHVCHLLKNLKLRNLSNNSYHARKANS